MNIKQQEYLAARALYMRRLTAVRAKLAAVRTNLSQISHRIQVYIRRVEQDINRKSYMEKIIAQRFAKASTRSIGGTKWKRDEDGGIPLQGSGVLKRAAMNAVSGTYNIKHNFDWRPPANPPYARVHQYGSFKRDIPARPYILNPNQAELLEADNYARRELDRLLKLELRK